MQNRYDLPLPFGWFIVGYSKELNPGESKPLNFFDEELVLFRTQDGEAKVLEAHCPHMGAHLGYGINGETGGGGEVVGDSITCPFHGWKFNGEGYCTEVPYANSIPPKVKDQQVLRSYPVTEINQTIFAWYHPKGDAPSFEVDYIPELDPENEEWGELDITEWEIDTHVQEMAENGADPAHFLYVHGVKDYPAGEMDFDSWPKRSGFIESNMKTPQGLQKGKIDMITNGPGQSYVRFTGICETVQQACATPITGQKLRFTSAYVQKLVDGKEQKGGVGAALKADLIKQIDEDKIIWEHKKFRVKPSLCDGDGPISKFRKWYGRFYV